VQLVACTPMRSLEDRHIRRRALEAVADPHLTAEYAHVFDARAVRRALGRFGRANAI